jgi:hypothetical protein
VVSLILSLLSFQNRFRIFLALLVGPDWISDEPEVLKNIPKTVLKTRLKINETT